MEQQAELKLPIEKGIRVAINEYVWRASALLLTIIIVAIAFSLIAVLKTISGSNLIALTLLMILIILGFVIFLSQLQPQQRNNFASNLIVFLLVVLCVISAFAALISIVGLIISLANLS